jgi:uncharacterized membrane protein
VPGADAKGKDELMSRLPSIDALRGLVMIIMALDHVRDFFHRAAMSSSPTDLRVTTPALFLTRWVTHICAPTFMLTAGLGAYLYWWTGRRTKTHLSRFLVTRGLWLIGLELTVMQLGYNFDISSSYPIFLLVLWVLGACMVAMAALVWLPLSALAALSVSTIVLHHLLDGVSPSTFGSFAPVWNVLHQVGAFPFAGRIFIAAYPLVPWIAVMALGFCLGPLFLKPVTQRRRTLIAGATGLTVGFVIVRALNVYGDPAPWSAQSSPVLTAMSFVNATKYPPSLAFLLMTLGPALLLLGVFEGMSFSRRSPLIVFGRVPLFYFVLHFFAAHAAAIVAAVVVHGTPAWSFMLQPVPSMGGPAQAFPPNFGYDLWVTYLAWLIIVAGLYPICAWFAGIKEQHPTWWLSYL